MNYCCWEAALDSPDLWILWYRWNTTHTCIDHHHQHQQQRGRRPVGITYALTGLLAIGPSPPLPQDRCSSTAACPVSFLVDSKTRTIASVMRGARMVESCAAEAQPRTSSLCPQHLCRHGDDGAGRCRCFGCVCRWLIHIMNDDSVGTKGGGLYRAASYRIGSFVPPLQRGRPLCPPRTTVPSCHHGKSAETTLESVSHHTMSCRVLLYCSPNPLAPYNDPPRRRYYHGFGKRSTARARHPARTICRMRIP